MIIPHEPLLESYHFAAGVFGTKLSLGGFLIILLIVGIVLFFLIYFWFQGYRRTQHALAAKGKVLCEFTSPSGLPVIRLLCEEYKGEVKTIEDKSRATFTTNLYAKAPKGHAIDEYLLLPEHDYLDVYPYGVKMSQQILVKKYYFQINDPCPKIPHDAAKWDTERYIRVSSAMAKLAKDESNLQVLVSEMSGVWHQIEEFVVKLKMIPQIRMLQFITMILIVIVGFMSFMSLQNSGAVKKFLMGGK